MSLARLFVSKELANLSRSVQLDHLVVNPKSTMAFVSAFVGEEYAKTMQPCLDSACGLLSKTRIQSVRL